MKEEDAALLLSKAIVAKNIDDLIDACNQIIQNNIPGDIYYHDDLIHKHNDDYDTIDRITRLSPLIHAVKVDFFEGIKVMADYGIGIIQKTCPMLNEYRDYYRRAMAYNDIIHVHQIVYVSSKPIHIPAVFTKTKKKRNHKYYKNEITGDCWKLTKESMADSNECIVRLVKQDNLIH